MFKACMSFMLFAGILPFLFIGTHDASAAENSPQIPYLDAWAGSAHAYKESESFRHWDKDGKVPIACAKCHSSDGFRDYVGADASTVGVVDQAAKTDSVITCVTCHNDASAKLNIVHFPSALSIANTGSSSRCMICHQGRSSGAKIDAAVDGLSPDKVSDKLKFINVHYRAAAATLWGATTKIGYQYIGANYQGRLEHPSKFDECTECHDPHALKVRVATCARCHETVKDLASLRSIRSAEGDFDGDGNVSEGIAHEISTLQDRLFAGMQAYAKAVIKKPLAYDAHAYPYFFHDSNANGLADNNEAEFKNQYKAWTPRLLKAAYNYQFALKDPGAYAHNPQYVIQLLFDSLSDLSTSVRIDMSGLVRP